MTIEITRPEIEELIRQRLHSGAFDSVEDVLFDALEVQKEREVTSPLALRLEGLFDRLTKARPGAAGVSAQYSVGDHTWHAGTDWIVSPTDVWVRASMIVELIGRWDPSGRGTAQAMGVNGWTPQRMAGGNRTRGYVHER